MLWEKCSSSILSVHDRVCLMGSSYQGPMVHSTHTNAIALTFGACVSCAWGTGPWPGLLRLDWRSGVDAFGSIVPVNPVCHQYRWCLAYPPSLSSIYSRQWESPSASLGRGDRDDCSSRGERFHTIRTQSRGPPNSPSHHSLAQA